MRIIPTTTYRAPAFLLAALTVFGASPSALAGEWGPIDAKQTPINWLRNCLIYTTEAVDIPGPFKIFAGPDDPDTYRSDLCSVETIVLGGLLASAVPKTAPKVADVALAAPSIYLERKSKTSECNFDSVQGAGLSATSTVTVECPSALNLDLSGMPVDLNAVIPFPTITIPAGTPDIEVAAGDTLALTPGTYGRIVLNLNSTLVLTTPGKYQVRSVATSGSQTRAYIEVESERTSLLVKEYFVLGHRTLVNPDGTRIFKIFVEGDDTFAAPVPGWLALVTGFSYQGDGTFNACYVSSPNATQAWRGKPVRQAGYTTQSFAKAYLQQDGLNIKVVHPQDKACFDPEYTCAALGCVGPGMACDSATGAVTVSSWNASATSLSYLLFIDEAQLTSVYPSVDAMRSVACLEFASTDLAYSPAGAIENTIITPNIWAADVLTNCGDGSNLVPMLVGPIDAENGPGFAPLCYSAYTFDRLNVASPETCTVIRP